MINKIYKIPVYREVASSELIKTSVLDSEFKLDVVKNERVVEVNEDLESIIYNVDRNRDQLVIYSNTLNLNITDKFFNTTPLYEKVVFSEEEEALSFVKEFKEYLIEKNIESFTVYFNSIKDDFVIGKEFLYNIGNPLNRSPDIKVRKLKNRFKITVRNINSEIANIVVKNRYLFSPNIHRNFLEFNECIVTLGTNQYYIYNNSFNLLEKVEINVEQPKDPVIEYIDSFVLKDYQGYEYTSWRSNLLFEQKIPTDFYYYLKLSYDNKTDLILQSVSKIDDPSLLFLCSSKVSPKTYKLNINPYLETEVITPVGENFSVVFDYMQDNKYNTYNNIKFGTERLLVDFGRFIKNTTNYVSTDYKDIYQENNLSLPTNYDSYKSTHDLPEYLRENLDRFKYNIQDLLEYTEERDNIKIYKSNYNGTSYT